MHAKRALLVAAATLALAGCPPETNPTPSPATQDTSTKTLPTPPSPETLNQGAAWGGNAAAQFYSTDQGSRLIPLAWINALTQADGTPFMADRLARYGYLRNTANPQDSMPVGFVVAPSADANPEQDRANGAALGMTCAACHTRDLVVNKTTYRVDGGPALARFGQFLIDLDAAMGKVQKGQPGFAGFAAAVLGPQTSQQAQDALAGRLTQWYQPFHAIIATLGPSDPWGVGRLDAISMIFDRVTGLDIGPPSNFDIIAGNLRHPGAPARYPFLWNAALQDRTQWPGFATNGSDILGLARNLGEVMGVFAIFHPKPSDGLLNINYLANGASANFNGLGNLEGLVRQIGAPAWPAEWPSGTEAQIQRGHDLYDGKAGGGVNCASCHWDKGAIKAGVPRQNLDPFQKNPTWCTPVQVVGTDIAEWNLLGSEFSKVDTGVLNGAHIPLVGITLKQPDTALNTLTAAVTGSIIDHIFDEISPITIRAEPAGGLHPSVASKDATMKARLAGKTGDLGIAFAHLSRGRVTASNAPHCGVDYTEPPTNGYESRVLFGIWAAAPYLHNGSVPSLRDLLNPSHASTADAEIRPKSFAIGNAYDPVTAGLATVQPGLSTTLVTTGCDEVASGNSNCGHEGVAFGTTLSAADKDALVAYLKTL